LKKPGVALPTGNNYKVWFGWWVLKAVEWGKTKLAAFEKIVAAQNHIVE